MDEQNQNPTSPSSSPQHRSLRDVLGGDEEKEVAPSTIPVETPSADPQIKVEPGFVPETPVGLPPSPHESSGRTASAISVMPTPDEVAEGKITKPLREIPLQNIPTMPVPPPPPKVEVEYSPEDVAPPSPPVDPEDELDRKGAIRTLQSDIARTVQGNQLSIAEIAMRQQEKNRKKGAVLEEEETKERHPFFTTGSVLLIIGGILALGLIVYFLPSSITGGIFGKDIQTETILPTENIEVYNVSTSTRARLFERISEFTTRPDAEQLETRALIFTKEILGTTTETAILSLEGFFEAIDSRATGRLVRTLGPEMMFGAIDNHPFLITPSDSYENTFAGMLEWEPLMAEDVPFLVRTIPEPPPPPVATSSVATTSSAIGTTTPVILPQSVVHTSSWRDIVVKNVDTRALLRDDGEVLLLYAFLKNNLLLIASRKETMAIILDILATPQFGL